MWLAVAAVAPGSPPVDATTIVVTGERVRRSIRDTASSVSVATERDIEATGANRADQMLQLVPNVQLGNGSVGPTIRGQDSTGALQALPAFLGGNRPRVTLIVDGRRTTYNEFVFGAAPLWDTGRIEVFRSPQTTTQGQNSIAGAIFVYSNDPTFDRGGSVRGIVGNYHTAEVSGVVSGPLSADAALRFAGDLRYSHTTSHIADRIEGGDPNHDVYGLARAKLLVKPRGMPGTRLLFTYTHNQSQAPQDVEATRPFKNRRDEGGFYGTFRINVDAITANAHQQIAGSLSADVTVTAGNSLAERLAFVGLGQTRTTGNDWSAETVFAWSPDGPASAVGGVSWSHLKLRQLINLSRLNGAIGRFRDAQDSGGVFGEANFKVLPATTLTLGLRYQADRQDRTGDLATSLESIPLDFRRTFHAWLPKLSLAYDLGPTARAGLLIQRAYNPGGTTLRFDVGRPDNFEAEKLWDFELFARAQLADGLGMATNIFYYDIRDAQRLKPIVIVAPGGFPVGFADLFNAPKARSYGAEAEMSWRPNARLTGRLSLGILRTRLVDAGPDYPEYSGNDFSRSPHFSAAAAVDWSASNRLRLSAQARHHSRYFADDGHSPDLQIPASTIVDARAEYRLRTVTAFVSLRNLFDKLAIIDRFNATSATLEDPRMITIGLESRF